MTRRKGVAVESDDLMRQILEAETPVVTIVGKTWLLHVTEVLRATPEENLAMIGDTVKYSEGPRQNGHLRRRALLRRLQGRAGIRAGHVAGGGKGRRGLRCAVRHQRRLSAGGNRAHHRARQGQVELPPSASTRTTTAAWAWPTRWPASKPARRRCRAPINGYGERTGNCNLTSVIPLLHFKMKHALRAGEVAAEAEGAFRVRGRDRQRAP